MTNGKEKQQMIRMEIKTKNCYNSACYDQHLNIHNIYSLKNKYTPQANIYLNKCFLNIHMMKYKYINKSDDFIYDFEINFSTFWVTNK